jgi:crotonobetainyl-CoA:carnitine CoA-transferase CaiB-like acyl-CoA transferase
MDRRAPRSPTLRSCHNQAVPPLTGVRVIDFTRVIAGPFCTQILSDMGAEVIKIENPDGGDDTRKGAGPRAGGATGESHFFMTFNRGKKSVTLDFTKPDGQKIVHRLLEKADVVIQNFRPGVLNRYGLDYASLHETHPRLIYLSIPPYGQTGPLSDRPGYDPVLQAESGMMSVNGEADGEGMRHAIAIVDTMTGIHSWRRSMRRSMPAPRPARASTSISPCTTPRSVASATWVPTT